MNAVILACSSLAMAVTAAQKKMNTNYPIVYVDRKYHADPSEMRLQLISALKNMEDEVDTVLVAMGFCGFSWNDIHTDKRIVIPYADDCVTISLCDDEMPRVDRKQEGHFYFKEPDRGDASLEAMRQRLCERMGNEDGNATFQKWFQYFTHIDIIDTGLYDSYEPHHLTQTKRDAELTGCQVQHVPGGNILLEKLISGRWDEQFIVAEPQRPLSKTDFT